jgi:hypothetical protein
VQVGSATPEADLTPSPFGDSGLGDLLGLDLMSDAPATAPANGGDFLADLLDGRPRSARDHTFFFSFLSCGLPYTPLRLRFTTNCRHSRLCIFQRDYVRDYIFERLHFLIF